MEERFLLLAEKMLLKNGFEINISKKVLSEFNVDSGSYDKTYLQNSGLAIYLSLDEGDFLNKSFATDKIKSSLLVYSKDTEISIDNTISFNGNEYNILHIEKIKAKLTTIVYKILIG